MQVVAALQDQFGSHSEQLHRKLYLTYERCLFTQIGFTLDDLYMVSVYFLTMMFMLRAVVMSFYMYMYMLSNQCLALGFEWIGTNSHSQQVTVMMQSAREHFTELVSSCCFHGMLPGSKRNF